MAKSVEGTTTTEYVYRGHDPLFENNTGTGVFTDYIYVNGRMVAKQTGSDTDYYIKDALGSTRLVYRGTSQVFSVATYAPFGTPVSASGTEKFRYAGEMLAGAAGSSPGIYYIGARWMDPELGRWLSLDSELGRLSAPQTMNRYVYCVNNPLKFTDPTGEWFGISLKTTLQVIIIVAAVAATVATAGIASPLAAMAVGAAIGATSSAASTWLAGGSLSDIATSALIGGVAGAIGGGIGAGITKSLGGGLLSKLNQNLVVRFAGDSSPVSGKSFTTLSQVGKTFKNFINDPSKGSSLMKTLQKSFRNDLGLGLRNPATGGQWNSMDTLVIGVVKKGATPQFKQADEVMLNMGVRLGGGGDELVRAGDNIKNVLEIPIGWLW
jgi:RHS repeat-associated protein